MQGVGLGVGMVICKVCAHENMKICWMSKPLLGREQCNPVTSHTSEGLVSYHAKSITEVENLIVDFPPPATQQCRDSKPWALVMRCLECSGSGSF